MVLYSLKSCLEVIVGSLEELESILVFYLRELAFLVLGYKIFVELLELLQFVVVKLEVSVEDKSVDLLALANFDNLFYTDKVNFR